MNQKHIIAFILLQTAAQAAPVGNGPYSPAEHPSTVPLRSLEFTKQTDETGVYRIADSQTEIRLFYKDFEGLSLELTRAGKVIFPKSFMCGGVFYGDAWQAELNLDGQPDYVLAYETGGNGIAPVYVIFLLSTGNGYTLACTTSHFEESDLIFIQGKPRMILSEMRMSQPSTDGKEHTFWIYNLLGFDKGKIKLDNSGAGIFPKIVWFSDAPNYRETTLLTPEQKADLIRRAQSGWRVSDR